MTTRIRLSIDVAIDRDAICRGMAARSRMVSVVDDAASSDAVLTDKSDSALAAVGRGRSALVLDPFRLAAEARGELAASKRAVPAHTARYGPAVRQIRQRLDAGKLGEPGLLRIHRWAATSADSRNALHSELDLALWFFGERPSRTYAVKRPGYLQAHLGFAGGGMAIIDLDDSAPSGSDYYSLSLIGSDGAAYADDQRNMHLLLGPGGAQAVRASQGSVGLGQLIDDFASTVQQARDCSPFWNETDSAIQVSDDVRRAADAQQVVSAGDRHA